MSNNTNNEIPAHRHDIQDITGLTTVLSSKSNATHIHSVYQIKGLTELLNQKANSFKEMPSDSLTIEYVIRSLILPEFKVHTYFKNQSYHIDVNFLTTNGYSMNTVRTNLRYKCLNDVHWKEAYSKRFIDGILSYHFVLDNLSRNSIYNLEIYLTDKNNPHIKVQHQETFITEKS